MKTLLVVNGGDAPGINAALYHYTALAESNGDTVLGANGAFAGILADEIKALRLATLAPTVGQGGTYLVSSREPVLKDAQNRKLLVSKLVEYGVDNVVLFGGDGTLRYIPNILQDLGIVCIGIPATIDNDVPGTEQTIGFASACQFAHATIDGMLATGRALPGRAFTVETLGGYSGFLALEIAYAAGAQGVFLPEYESDVPAVAQHLKAAIQRYRWGLAIICEGAKPSPQALVDQLKVEGIDLRSAKLGHAQRGSPPVHQDRTLAARMMHTAYNALRDGATGGTVVVRNGVVQFSPDTIANQPKRVPDRRLYDFVNGMS